MKYGGSFAKGFAGAISGIPGIIADAKRRKEDKALIDKAAEEMKTNTMSYAAQIDKVYKDGRITDQEYQQTLGITVALGNDFTEQWRKLYSDYRSMESEDVKARTEEIQSAYQVYTDYDFTNKDQFIEALDAIEKNTKSDKTRAQISYLRKSALAQEGTVTEKAKTWTSHAAAQAANPNMEIKFDAPRGVYYVVGEKAPEKEYEFEAKMEEADKALERGEISLAEWKQIRIRLLGGSANVEGGKTIPISLLESTRDKMKVAETWEGKGGAKEILTDLEGAKYSTEQVKVHKEEWTRERITERKEDIEFTKETLEELLGAEGTLRPTEEYELEVGGGKTDVKTKLEWYQILYEQYNRELDRLEKIGVDISRYKKLIAPEDLKTLGYSLDVLSKGREMKDIKGIWQ